MDVIQVEQTEIKNQIQSTLFETKLKKIIHNAYFDVLEKKHNNSVRIK